MTRLLGAALLLVGVACLAPARADDPKALAAGNYKLVLPNDNFFLIALTEADGKWVADYLGATMKLPSDPKLSEAKVVNGVVSLKIAFGPGDAMTFEGRPKADGSSIPGTLDPGGQLIIVRLEPTRLKDAADPIAVAQDRIEAGVKNPAYFKAAATVAGAAKAKKLPRELVADVLDKAAKGAAEFGPRYERRVLVDLLGAIAGQEGMQKEGLKLAERAEALIDPAGDLAENLQAVRTLAAAYEGLGKADSAQKLRASAVKLEERDYVEYSKKNTLLKSPPFAGRKAKSDRVAVVELFTGAECPPCVAVDMAFDGLEAVYKPSDVVFLQYHMHVPGPDALTVPDCLARAEFYGDAVRGTPSLFVSGTPDATGGGGPAQAKAKFDIFTKKVDAALEKEAGAKIAATATRKGKDLAIDVKVTGVAKPGPKVSLRMALVEERVRYAGGNGLRYHTSVVRAMPGGAKGFPVEKAELDKTLTIDLAELQKSIDKYLADFAAKEDEFPSPDRAGPLSKLKLVAFVQDDATKEIFQATSVDVSEGK